MPNTGNKVLSKMLDRLLAGLMSGPNMNCRPHKSRQRIDLTQLTKLQDQSPEQILLALLGAEKSAQSVARVKAPRKSKDEQASPAEKAWLDQSALLAKLRVIADDARTYENDTGVHALSIGFPLLSLPPGSFAGGPRNSTKRILAPIAFIPVTLSLKGGATPSVELACRGEGADRVVPNTALLSWIEQQTGKPPSPDAFEDQEGTDPWREITELVQHVAGAMRIDAPNLPKDFSPRQEPENTIAEAESKADSESPKPVLKGPFRTPGSDAEINPPKPVSEGTPRRPGSDAENDPKPVPEGPPRTPASEVEIDPLKPASEGTPRRPGSDTEDPLSAEKPNDPTLARPPMLHLNPAPQSDEDAPQPAILLTAVLGLFPTAHQGLVRDTRSMLAEQNPLTGPIQNFLTSGVDFDIPATSAPLPVDQPKSQRPIATERLAAAADPCQARAVSLARQSAGLVIHGPPGTGKSQTITNIISDHLARGQRVLLVCEKRTALDVVADRLEHMGLGNLCAIVHDPQRDQRDLYKSVHQQLDDLPEAALHPRADTDLQKTDAELQQLHDELTGYHQSLMQPTTDGSPSFHELMGRWMAFHDGSSVRLDDEKITGVTVEQLESAQHALAEMFDRATAVDFCKNPWKGCAGVSLGDFLSRPMATARTAMSRILAAADAADATADDRIPPFTDNLPVQQQATARVELASDLAEIIPQAVKAGLAFLAGEDISKVRSAQAQLDTIADEISQFRTGPLDPGLTAFTETTIAQIKRDLFSLQRYLDASAKWTAIFAFAAKSEAAGVLKKFALPRTPADAERVKKFLLGLQARLILSETFRESKLATDERIEHYLTTAAAWFPMLQRIANEAALKGVASIFAKVFAASGFAEPPTPDAENPTQNFLDGLKLSPARADAIVRLEEEFTNSALFDNHWLTEFSAALRNGKLAHDTAAALVDRLDQLEGVLRVRAARSALSPELGPAADQILTQLASTDDAMAALQQKVLTQAITKRLKENPTLHAIDAHRINSAFDRFRQLDQQKKQLVQRVILHQWISRQKERLLASTGSRLNAVGAALRARMVSRGQNAKRLRQVIALGSNIEAGDPLFDLCPVWMASPETVAQIFPRAPLFDVVVFDEASQCRLEEALPVLTRGKRVVIAGDPHQLPPTRFFESGLVQSEQEEAETEQELFESQQGEVEDLLAAALNLSIQQCYLDVHYRSRNADLIEFSNRNFYSSRLQAIPGHPSNRSRFSPLTLYRVDGIYNKRQNEAEADRVVQIVRDLLKRAAPPSIGIACLNLPQRDLITEKLDELAAEDNDFAKRLAAARTRKGQGSFEGLFVKNLENVQGDERDDIIISTTYGPDTTGKFYRRFGPLGMTGGGRRLNVLVTRARNEVHLVTSIPPETYRSLPVVPEGQSATGAWLLFAYLKYAEELAAVYGKENANIEQPPSHDQHPKEEAAAVILPSKSPSMFAQQLAESLAKNPKIGSDVHWGNEGFCVDLALHHPTRPGDVTIGVLCDGCRYTGADDALEWDIFRTKILADQGWQLQRIWTPHFFRDPQGNVKSIDQAAREFVATEKPIDAIEVRHA